MSRGVVSSKNLWKVISFLLLFWFISFGVVTAFSAATQTANNMAGQETSRRGAFQKAAAIVASALLLPQTAHALSVPSGDAISKQAVPQPHTVIGSAPPTVAYRPLSLDIPEFGVSVPVAMWYPANASNQMKDDNSQATIDSLKYNHRISVKKIGQLLAGWDFIPEFASKDFELQPTMGAFVVDGMKIDIPSSGPVVFLAHGYLGSRFDLSHVAEALAQEGTSLE